MSKLNQNDVPLYAPEERFQFELPAKRIKAYSPSMKTYSELPDPVRDPIVCNDISSAEFDYTFKDYKYF